LNFKVIIANHGDEHEPFVSAKYLHTIMIQKEIQCAVRDIAQSLQNLNGRAIILQQTGGGLAQTDECYELLPAFWEIAEIAQQVINNDKESTAD
jgi:hypothetical protein